MSKENEAWLIESYWNGTLVYWTGKPMKTSYGPDIKTGWSKDANEALRFSREQDAWTVLSWSLDGEGRVALHMWMDATMVESARAETMAAHAAAFGGELGEAPKESPLLEQKGAENGAVFFEGESRA